jgi:PAS domain S-box-containing protein
VSPVADAGGGSGSEQLSSELASPLRALLANAPLVLFALDRDGVFTASEGAGLRVLGLKRGEVVGRSVFQVYAQVPQLLELIRRVLQGESLKWVVEVEGAWWETHAEPMRDEYDRTLGVVGIATDVTERRRAEEQMLETEERFRKLAEATFEAVAIHEAGKVLLANHACATLFRYEPRELIGMNVIDLAAPESRAVVAEHVRAGHEEAYEATGLCKDGSRFPAELRARMMKYRGQTVRVTAVRDLTAQKRAEAQLRETLQASEGLLSTAAQQLQALLAAPDAGLPPEQLGRLREVASLVERARDLGQTGAGPT